MKTFYLEENQDLLFCYGFHLEPIVRRDLPAMCRRKLDGRIEAVYGFDSGPGRYVR